MVLNFKLYLLVWMLFTESQQDAPGIFYPFGSDAGDDLLYKNDDGYEGPINIITGFPYFEETFYSLFVNTNGGVSFEEGISSYTPNPFPIPNDAYFIAVFWADVDTTENDGSIYYRETTDPEMLAGITADVLAKYSSRGLYFFKASWAYIVTWERVTHYGGSATSPVNSFQLVLLTDGTYSFTIFNFGEITWTYGTASNGVDAQVGFNAGDGTNYFVVPGSRTPDIIDVEETTNVGVKGRWIFRVDQAKIDAGKCFSSGSCAFNEEDTGNGCQVIAPALKDCPQLVGPQVVQRAYIYFYCDLQHDFTENSLASFEVTFLFDDEPGVDVPVVTTTSAKRVALHEKYLAGNLGKWISCSVVTYFTQSPEKKSAPYISNSYFAAITPSSYDVTVHEGDEQPALVHLRSSLPVTCDSPILLSWGCHVNFNIISSDDLLVHQKTTADPSPCQYKLEKEDWKDDESLAYNEEYHLEVLTVRGPLLKPPRVDTIRFKKEAVVKKFDASGNEYVHFWTDYSPPAITVYRYDGPGATCVASGDPRMTTFDGVYYPVYKTGQFVLARSSSQRNFEVHVRHKKCDRTVVACVCAVAVREGNDTLSLDMCKSRLKLLHRTASTKLNDGAKIISNGANAYTIRVPSGTYVNVNVFDWGMNVYLKVLSQDKGKTEGLCGTFDNNPENDFKPDGSNNYIDKDNSEALGEFINSWAILPGLSLFEKDPSPLPRRNAQESCSCEPGQSVCGKEADEDDFDLLPPRKRTILKTSRIPGKNTLESRRKRDTMLDTETDYVDFEYDPSDFDYALNSTNDFHFDWPTDTGIHESQAWEYCNTSLVQSVVYQACSNHTSDLHLDDVILKCVEDIKVTGSYDWANDKISELQGNCIDAILESNITVAENTTSEAVSETVLNMVEEIVSNICPNQCHGRGACQNSTCVCMEGYEGVDCSVNSSSLPNITSLANGGLCNFQQTPCQTVYVTVENIVDTEALGCQIEVVETEEVFYTNATYQGLQALICPLPPLSLKHNLLTYYLSITKNGTHYGTSRAMQVFDGNCIECYSIQQCDVLNSHCSINSECFEFYAEHPNNTCFVCDPTESQTTWSISPENGKPKFVSPSSYAKLINETAVITLKAVDPENETVAFLMDQNLNLNVTLLQNGTLIWKESSNETMTIPVITQDVCGQNHTEFISLSIMECPCPGNSICIFGNSNGSGLYDCTCPPGFTDKLCQTNINDCLNVSCNQGECMDGINMYTCRCDEGYTGGHCETEIIECTSSPCQYGTCIDKIAAYTCLCNDGYTGHNCETDIDECSSGPCQNGNCSDGIAGYNCECLGGHTGVYCESDINECQSSPCVNGTCFNEIDMYRCQCLDGFSGINCEQDIDECASSPCIHGTCIDSINLYSCLCVVGFTGDLCELNIDDCSSNPCVHGTCQDGISNFQCICSGGFSGGLCDVDINECASSPCLNGYCTDLIDQFNCTCDPGYEGVVCETDTDECISNPCVNGICEDVVNGYVCNCSEIFLGIHCENDTRFAIWGEWSGYSPCTKSCDYGTQTRQRQCLLPGTCSGIGEEMELCNTNNCLEIEEEAKMGITVVISGANIEEFIENVEEMLKVLADGMNQHCNDDPMSCCSLGSSLPTSFESGSFDILQSDNIQIGSGFPKELENGDILVLIIGEVTQKSLSQVCFNRSDGSNDTIPITADVIEEAIVISEERIQTEFQFTITVQESPQVDSSKDIHDIYIVLGTLGAVCLLTLAVIFSIYVMKRKKRTMTFDVQQ